VYITDTHRLTGRDASYKLNVVAEERSGGWRRGVAVTSLGVSAKLHYVGPG